MKKVLGAFLPINMMASDLYRGSSILHQLRHADPEIEVLFFEEENLGWKVVEEIDLVYMMKLSSVTACHLAEMATQSGKGIWYDCDDDLFNVPLDNPAYHYYSNSLPSGVTIRKNIRTLLQKADVVTVSTEHLRKEYVAYNHNTLVVPNALNDYMLKEIDQETPRQKIISWRGGTSHMRDLEVLGKQLTELIQELQDWKWCFMGYNPWKLMEVSAERTFHVPLAEYYDYMHHFKNLSPAIHIIPLVNNKFNRSKSNNAALEAIYAGAIPVIPEWPHWDFPGAIRYTAGGDNFKEAVKEAVALTENEAEFKRLTKANLAHVKENYLLSKINQQRVEVINALINKTSKG